MTVLTLETLESTPHEDLVNFEQDGTCELELQRYDELVTVKRALANLVKNQDDFSDTLSPETIVAAKGLRDQLDNDIQECMRKSFEKVLPAIYEVSEPELVQQAVAHYKEQMRPKQGVSYPEFDWLYNPDNTHGAAREYYYNPPRSSDL